MSEYNISRRHGKWIQGYLEMVSLNSFFWIILDRRLCVYSEVNDDFDKHAITLDCLDSLG